MRKGRTFYGHRMLRPDFPSYEPLEKTDLARSSLACNRFPVKNHGSNQDANGRLTFRSRLSLVGQRTHDHLGFQLGSLRRVTT